MFMLLYDSLHLTVSVVKRWTLEEVEQQLDCIECKMHLCTVLLKEKIAINYALIAFNIC